MTQPVRPTGLSIGGGLTLPIEAVTETFAILAKRGSGKTYTAKVLAEELLAAGLPTVVIDPVGVWWGLRSSSDGTHEGESVVIFGGDHADVPLEPTAGHLVADVVVDQRLSVVIDLSLLSKAGMRRFMTDFIERLYHRNREPLHVIVDEADAFAPQRPQADGARLLGAMEDLVRRGRARGIGVTLISQRPAVLHKDVLTQAEVLIALRMTGPRDVAAIDEWVRLHADEEQARQVKDSLPSLPVGTAWVWSPGWLGILQQVAVRTAHTFDSSATPTAGRIRIEPRRMAAVDLAALGEQIARTVERAKAEDPKALRARIADLEHDLEAARRTPAQLTEVPVLSAADLDQLRALAPTFHAIANALTAPAQDRPVTGRPPALEPASHRPASAPQAAPTAPPADVRLKTGAVRMLDVVVSHHPMRLTRAQLATLARMKVTGGTFGTYFNQLRRSGLISIDADDHITATEAGFARAGASVSQPATPAEALQRWRSVLKRGAREMLDALVDSYPAGMSRQQLADAVQLEVSGGTFGTYLGHLRRNGLADVDQEQVRASATLFTLPD